MSTLGFGDEFKDMTEREILISLHKDIKSLDYKVSHITCPSPRCADHDNRIQRLEDSEEVKEQRQQNNYLVWGLFISAVAGWGGLAISVILLLRGG